MQAGEIVAERYEVLSTIGRGGMGEVYRCHDLAFGRDVALKRIRSDIGPARHAEIDQLFYKEAAALASVTHPSVIRAYDFGFLRDGTRYLSMEYVEGLSLEVLWKKEGILAWHLLGAVMDQLLSGLAHLHARGLVHRDLKPANIMLSDGEEGPRVTILDLGLATFREVAILEIMRPEKPPEAKVARYATPPYCAPEQLLHHAMFLGPTTDLHAVGILLYQLSAGELPFPGESDAELFEAVLRQRPRRLSATNGAPKALGPIIERLLAKRPWHRYDFANTVREALAPLWAKAEANAAWRDLCRRHRLRDTRSPAANAAIIKRSAPPALFTLRVGRLFGREREQARLLQTIEAVNSGSQEIVALIGEAGVGKSRLGQWLVEHVHERGLMHNLRISYGRTGGALSGFLSALERHFGLVGAPAALIERALDTRWGHDKAARRLVRALVRELRTDEGGKEGKSEEHSELGPGQTDRRNELFMEVLRRIAGDRPLLLWFDDIHRARKDCLSFVEAILASQALPRVFFLITGRPFDPDGAISRVLSTHDCATQILQPLGRGPVEAMLTSLLSREDDANAQPDHITQPFDAKATAPNRKLLDTLYRASRGNPLFVMQQLHAWSRRTQIWWEGDAHRYRVDAAALKEVAKDTATLWKDHVATLSAGAQLAALAATTLGSGFERELLASLFEALGLNAAKTLLEFVREDILVPEVNHLWWYHDTLEEHLGEAFEASLQKDTLRTQAIEVLRKHPQAKSRPYALLITRNLLALGRNAEASTTLLDATEERWERRRVTLHIHEDLDLLGERVVESERGRFLCLRSRAAWAACDYRSAIDTARQALAWAEERGEKRTRAVAHQLLGDAERALSHYREASVWFRQALETWLSLGENLQAAQIYLTLGQGEHYLARYAQAEDLMRHTLKLAEHVKNDRLATEGRWWLAWVLLDRGRYEEARREAEIALTTFISQDNPLGVGQSHWLLAVIRGQQDATEEAIAHLEATQTPFEEAGDQWWLFATKLVQVWLTNVLGDWSAALEEAKEVLEIFEHIDSPPEMTNALLAQAAAQVGSDNLDAAEITLSRVASLARPEPTLQQIEAMIRAWIATTRGAWDEAEKHLENALSLWRTLDLTAWSVPWRLRDLLPRHPWSDELRLGLETWLQRLDTPAAPSSSS